MRKDRLMKLCLKLMEPEVEKHFNMNHWLSKQAKACTKKDIIADCGTSACAMGWACTISEFKGAGLKMALPYELGNEGCSFPIPLYKGKNREYAAADFFEINAADARDIFLSQRYGMREREKYDNVSPKDVVNKIIRLMAARP